jgi:hypothetical protein
MKLKNLRSRKIASVQKRMRRRRYSMSVQDFSCAQFTERLHSAVPVRDETLVAAFSADRKNDCAGFELYVCAVLPLNLIASRGRVENQAAF